MQVPSTHNRERQTILSDRAVFRRHPSPQDVAELQALIATNEASLDSLNEEIEACSRRLGALRTKARAHTLTIRRCQAAMTLARLIPPELLAKIFEHACEMGWTRAPIVVSQVCSTWRVAAHSHPGVWSRLTVNLDMQDLVGWVEHWLSMARHAPLHVAIVHGVPTTSLGRIMALLLERSEQWASLALDLHLASTRQVLATCTARFTKLRSINLSLLAVDESIEAAEDTACFANAFQNAPVLTSVSIVGNVIPRDLPQRLTSLRIEYSNSGGFPAGTSRSVIRALQNLPELETLALRLGVVLPAVATPPDVPDINLPNLKTLVYEDLLTGEFPILNHLAAPSLTKLYAHVQPDPDVYGAPIHLIRFLEDSPNVETLELDGVDIWPAQWHSTLSLLPNLRELHLHDSDIDDNVIEEMFRGNGLCPNLQKIDLRWCQHIRGTTLVRLVESRAEGGHKIEEVAAIACSLVRKQDAMRLASLTTFRVVIREQDKHCRASDFHTPPHMPNLTRCSPR